MIKLVDNPQYIFLVYKKNKSTKQVEFKTIDALLKDMARHPSWVYHRLQ